MKRHNKQDASFAAKWSGDWMNQSFTMIPSLLIENQKALGINHLELNVLVQLLSFQYYADSESRPSLSTIAERTGVSYRTVQRTVHNLEDKNLLKLNLRPGETFVFEFKPLIQALNSLDNGVQGDRTTETKPPRSSVSNKEDRLSKKESNTFTYRQRLNRANFSHKPRFANPITTEDQLRRFEETGVWPDELRT